MALIQRDGPADLAPAETREIVGPDGQRIRTRRVDGCPQCGAGADRQVPSSGFGTPHMVCQQCGYEEKDA